MNKSSIGISEKLAAVLVYLFPILGGILFLIFDYQNRFIRLHATQSIFFGLAWLFGILILFWLSLIPFIGVLFVVLQWIFNIACIVITLVAIVRVLNDSVLKIPVVYDWAYSAASK